MLAGLILAAADTLAVLYGEAVYKKRSSRMVCIVIVAHEQDVCGGIGEADALDLGAL